MAGIPSEDRYREILSLVRARGYVANEELAQRLRVAVQTIRRDVNHLAGIGQLTRHHGGAGLVSSIENIAYAERQVLNRREKEAIGQIAAREIPDQSSLFINIGTTTEAFARALLHHQGLRVITNNLHVASTLAPRSSFRVVVAGGTVRSHDGGITGPTATAMIDQYRADFGVIGISGIEEDGTLLDFDLDEIELARTIMRNARTVFLLADHTKFGRRPMGRVGHLSDVQALFTDRPPPPSVRAVLAQHQVALHVSGQTPKEMF